MDQVDPKLLAIMAKLDKKPKQPSSPETPEETDKNKIPKPPKTVEEFLKAEKLVKCCKKEILMLNYKGL